jgi:uncharacterized membrane protein (DUF485 family)
MDVSRFDRVQNHPRFKQLVEQRGSFATKLSIVMLVIYFGFVLVVAFAPHVLSQPVTPGSATTWGIPVGVFVILSAFVLTGIYVRRANGEFDQLTKQILEEVK